MSQPLSDSAPEATQAPETVQVLLSDRPLSELQRAVQVRAREDMERARARASSKPSTAKRIAMLALALIPCALLFTAVDGLMRVFHHMNYIYNSPDAAPVQTEPEPAQPFDSSAEPGMVLLQSLPDASKPPPAPPAPTP